MNFFFENLWFFELLLGILIIIASTIYFKGESSPKWHKVVKKLDKIWIKLCWFLLGVMWLEAIISAYALNKELK